MAKIAYTDRGGVRSWVCSYNGGTALRWSEHISDATEFVDDAAVTAFLAGKTTYTLASAEIVTQVAGPIIYGKRLH